ncbi:MAG: TIM barrel protein [Azospirillaceae bacterium]
MLRTGIATVSLSGDLEEKLDAIANAGFFGVEIFENDFLAFPAGARAVGQMVRDRGLEVALFQPFRDFEGLPEPLRSRALDRAERKFEVMQELGAGLMLVCSNVSPQALGGIDRAADDFRELGERAHARGLKVGFEALAWGRHVFDHRDAWEVVRRADHPAVGLVLDSFHTLCRDIDPDSIRRIPGDRIFFVQVADAPRLSLDHLSWSRHFRCMPGQGGLDVDGFLQAVAATGYAGYVSLEIFNDQFRAGSAKAVAVDGMRSLVAAADRVRTATSLPAFGVDKALPPPAVPRAWSFIECAVAEEEEAAIERRLRALGFVPAHRHVSKNVVGWRQGRINLLLNTERDGFAHAFHLLHGASVCALALEVDDAGGAAARAGELLAQPFEQPVAEGELNLPAIRGVGGSLIYFTDRREPLGRLWDVDFRETGDAGADADMGLIAIDHVSQSMEYDEMLSSVLFYTTLFGMHRTPEVDIADQGGLVRSQVVETRDGAVKIPLNGTGSHRTMAGRFLSDFFGSGVQHIAFATDDFFETAGRLQANGVEILDIPGNYYDDLGARFGLEEAFLRRLRAANALYDEDEHGTYLQLYTEPVIGRCFFEVVQRRGGYRGFGAANAAIRLAAQARSKASPPPSPD